MIDANTPFPGANGKFTMSVNAPWWAKWIIHDLTIYGGPFVRGFRDTGNAYGLALVEEVSVFCHDHLPIQDFSVPEQPVGEVQEAIKRIIMAAAGGKDAYVGCLGGWGRTGLFLSLVAKTVGIPDPVAYIRKNYTPKAVETEEQAEYVANFPVPSITVHEIVMEAFAERTWLGNHMRMWGMV